MENAVDALKMAAAVLIFIIAIGTSFSLFGTAKQTADSIIGMRDKQKYLESAELDNGILYTSSESVETAESDGSIESKITGVTTNGDRIVGVDDVVSTIYRYSIEKYGVTIVDSEGNVIVRFDSNTENLMSQYYNIDFNKQESKEAFEKYIDTIANNTRTIYTKPQYKYNSINIKKDNTLYNLYRIDVSGGATEGGISKISCGAPWYGNDTEIKKRIMADLSGAEYQLNNQTYQGKNILKDLKDASKIIEVINEIDQSKYLEDGTKTDLLQQYQMPTVEIVYILQ